MKRLGSIIFVVIFIFSLCGCSNKMSMTDEEWAAYRESCVSRYEVCSVYQYAKPITNNFGGVMRVEVCYGFTYIDELGELRSVDDFQHYEYGLTKVRHGDVDQYVVDSYGENTRCLYLSKDTLDKLTGTVS